MAQLKRRSSSSGSSASQQSFTSSNNSSQQENSQQQQEEVIPVVCRRQTTDLRDVQDVIKSVFSANEMFLNRHTSINEEESHNKTDSSQMEEYFSPPPLILRQSSSPAKTKSSSYILSPPLSQSSILETTPPVIETTPTTNPDTIDGPRGGQVATDPSSSAKTRPQSKRQSAPLYGEIIVLGTNGSLPCTPLSPKMSHRYVLKKQPKPTGVSLIVRNPKDSESLSRVHTHTVAMTLAKSKQMCVMEFGHDSSMDMFQIGRSTDSAIDIVVVDTVNGDDGGKVFNSSSSISRYACRILVEREPPYTARIYAAAFDTNKKIQLSAAAPSWIDHETGDSDSLTTNGITILRPEGVFESGVDPGQWKEVTVMGNIRDMRPLRSSRQPGALLPGDTNVLTDGCLIDLCGVTLMWRSAMGLEQGPSNTLIRDRQQSLNNMTPQCPVNFLTLHFKGGQLITTSNISSNNDKEDDLREPWAYMKCGHIFGQHSWKGKNEEDNYHRTCPICSKVGPYTKLELGNDRSFFVDDGLLSHTFSPCGHVTTEQTAKYWSKVFLPHKVSEWVGRCPFCSIELNEDNPYVKLYFN